MSKTVAVYPEIINDLLTNPGIGFVIAPNLMDPKDVIYDNRGTAVNKYKFTRDSKTWNHPDSKVGYCGVRWRELEPEQGMYCWKALEDKLEGVRALGCTAVVRCAPYTLRKDEDIPDWFRRECPEDPEFPFWRVDPNTSPYAAYWSRFIKAFAEHFDGHPVISSVDMALVGAWGEGGGTEFLQEDKIRQIVDAYIDNFKLTPLQALLHDPKSIGIIKERKEPVGFRVDCLGDMGGFHGEKWSHMLDFYPENICNFKMEEAWKKAPVVFEACWHMNDWYLQGWDIDYIIDESLKWHISSFNSKGTTVPEAWKENVERWLRRMGYRFELRKVEYQPAVLRGEKLSLRALWANVGVAPAYHKFPLIFRLVGDTDTFTCQSKEDIRGWLPDTDILLEEEIEIPSALAAGSYFLELGIENIKLAIAGEKDGYYRIGNVTVN